MSAIRKLVKDKAKLSKDQQDNFMRVGLSGLDWLILKRALKKNVNFEIKKSVINHKKKLRNLTKHTNNPFSNHEIISIVIFLPRICTSFISDWRMLYTCNFAIILSTLCIQ